MSEPRQFFPITTPNLLTRPMFPWTGMKEFGVTLKLSIFNMKMSQSNHSFIAVSCVHDSGDEESHVSLFEHFFQGLTGT